MTDPDARLAPFFDLATRSLEDAPEIRDEARGELMTRLASGADAEDAATALAIRKPGRSGSYPLFAAVVLLVLGTIAGFQVRDAIAETTSLSRWRSGSMDRSMVKVAARGEEEFVTVRLNSEATEVLRNLEKLIRERPDDAGLFEEYTGCHIAAVHALPPNYRKTWQRIDAGNGAWLLRDAMMKASAAFKGSGGSGPVTNEAAFAEALELLRQAAAAERFEIHSADLRARRLALLPEPKTLAEETNTIIFALSNTDSSLIRSTDFVSPLINEQAKRLAEAKDPEGLRELIGIWRHISHEMGTKSSSLLDSVTALGFAAKSQDALLKATRDLGMAAEEAVVDAAGGLIRSPSPIFRVSGEERKPMAYLSGGSGLAVPPPDVLADPSLFGPGRRAEYAVADRLFALVAALLCLLLLAVAGVESIRRGKLLNGLADGLAPLLRRVDIVWAVGLGLIAPAACYWILTRLTPLGGRDMGLLYYFPPPAALQALAGLLLVLVTLVQTVRWRLSVRVGFLGIRERPPWVGWLVVGLTALLIPAIGGVRWLSGDGENHLKAMAAACGIPLLWLLWQAAVVLCVQRCGALDGVLLSRRMVLPLAVLAAALLGSIPVLRHTERTWHRQDMLGRVDRDSGGFTRGEDRAVRWIADGFRKSFGPKN